MTLRAFEWERFRKSKVNLIFLACIAISTVVFTYLGIAEQKTDEDCRNLLLSLDMKRSESIVNYNQYALLGFHVVSRPTPMNLFFYSNGKTADAFSKIDSSEMINVEKEIKGENIFKRSGITDFGGILFFFGSLYALWRGVTVRRGKKGIFTSFNRHTALLRYIHLAVSFFLITLFNILIATLHGAGKASIFSLSVFLLYSLLFITFFYFFGTFCCRAFYKARYFVAFSSWLLIVFIVPEILYTLSTPKNIKQARLVNMEKFDVLFKQERAYAKEATILKSDPVALKKLALRYVDEHTEKVFNKNNRIENEYNLSVKRAIDRQSRWLVWLPTTFFRTLTQDLSGTGMSAYNDFIFYVTDMREQFHFWYIQKRYFTPETGKVESYIKNDENIYKQRFSFTGLHALGFLFTLALTAGLIVPLFVYRKKPLPDFKEILPLKSTERGKFYFVLAQKEADWRDIFLQAEHYKLLVIRRIHMEEYRTETSLRSWLWYHCAMFGVKTETVHVLLQEIPSIHGKMDAPVSSLSFEELNICWLAINLRRHSPANMYYLENFVNGFSREGEKQFLAIYDQIQYDCAMIYVGREMYEVRGPYGALGIDQSEINAVDPTRISLR